MIWPSASTVCDCARNQIWWASDILLIDQRDRGDDKGFDLEAFALAHDLIPLPVSGQWFTDTAHEIGMAQIIVPPTSRLIGKTITQARFRSTYDLSVIGMKHGTRPVADSVIDEPLRAGETPKRLRAGWFTDGSGQTFFALRYAGKPIEFAKGKNAIAVGELPALPAILDTLTDAVRAGELDEQLAKAAAERGQMLRKAS